MPYADVPGRNLRMYYSDESVHIIDPAKPNVVLIHASTSCVDTFFAQFEDQRLTRAFNLIGLDARLHGKTTGADRQHHVLEDSANCIMATVDKLQLESYFILGEGFHGATIAAWLAIKRPKHVKAMCFASPGYLREPEDVQEGLREYLVPGVKTNKQGQGLINGTIPEEIMQVLANYFFGDVTRQPERRARYLERCQMRYGTGNLSGHDILHILSFFGREPIPASLLAQIKVPVLILQGGADTSTSPMKASEGWQHALKGVPGGADIRSIAGAPHLMLYTDYGIANRFLLQFFSRHL